jgi:uncharacterized protein (DUF1684 family)
MAANAPVDAGGLLDWRRRVHALYAEVRSCSGPAEGHARWRSGRNELFATHPQSPVAPSRRAGLELPVAAYDPAWRFECTVSPAEPVRREVDTGTDGRVAFERVGAARLEGVGSLDVWWLAAYGGGIFVPLRDAGSGSISYGGGRYVLDTVKGADLGGSGGAGDEPWRLVIDLNFAYHPSCTYDPAWACPLAPRGNTVEVEVPVGELLPADGWY